jgi:hypothetical protein
LSLARQKPISLPGLRAERQKPIVSLLDRPSASRMCRPCGSEQKIWATRTSSANQASMLTCPGSCVSPQRGHMRCISTNPTLPLAVADRLSARERGPSNPGRPTCPVWASHAKDARAHSRGGENLRHGFSSGAEEGPRHGMRASRRIPFLGSREFHVAAICHPLACL